VGYTENDEDVQTVSELMDDIRDTVIDYQVCGIPNSFYGLLIQATDLDGAPTSHM